MFTNFKAMQMWELNWVLYYKLAVKLSNSILTSWASFFCVHNWLTPCFSNQKKTYEATSRDDKLIALLWTTSVWLGQPREDSRPSSYKLLVILSWHRGFQFRRTLSVFDVNSRKGGGQVFLVNLGYVRINEMFCFDAG